MSSDSRRAFLSRLSAIMAITGISGCTALTPTDVTIKFENDYKYEEKASFHIRHGNEQGKAETITLSPGEERVFTRSMKQGNSVVVTRSNNSSLSFTLQQSVCLDPVLEVNIGGLIGGGWSC